MGLAFATTDDIWSVLIGSLLTITPRSIADQTTLSSVPNIEYDISGLICFLDILRFKHFDGLVRPSRSPWMAVKSLRLTFWITLSNLESSANIANVQ